MHWGETNATMNPRGQGGEQHLVATSIERAGATRRVQGGKVCGANDQDDTKRDAEHYDVYVCA